MRVPYAVKNFMMVTSKFTMSATVGLGAAWALGSLLPETGVAPGGKLIPLRDENCEVKYCNDLAHGTVVLLNEWKKIACFAALATGATGWCGSLPLQMLLAAGTTSAFGAYRGFAYNKTFINGVLNNEKIFFGEQEPEPVPDSLPVPADCDGVCPHKPTPR